MNYSFKFFPSGIFAALLIFVYSLAFLVILLLPIAAWAKAVLVILLLCSLIYYLLRDAWLLLSSSSVAIRLEGESITVRTRGDGELQGVILDDCVVTSFLTVLNILPQGKTRARSILVFPDSMDSERRRELRVLLKWGERGKS